MTAARRAAALCFVLLPLALAACDGGGDQALQSKEMDFAAADRVVVTGSRMAGIEAAAPQAMPAPPPPPAPAPGSGSGAAANAQPAAPEGMLLAYSYSAGFELPVRNVTTLKDRHEAECRAAGPQLCLVLGGSVNGDGENYMNAYLSIRAEPRWLETFRNGLAEDAESANGRMTSQSTTAEDLTRSIVDTEARLEAQETLRERLIALLERPTDEVDDLLAAERELARVQGDIDSARSQLAVMRARVNMSAMTLNYGTLTNPVSIGAFAPVEAALRNFLSTLSGSLALVITIIAAAIPFVIILIPLIILVWRGFRRWRGRRRAARA